MDVKMEGSWSDLVFARHVGMGMRPVHGITEEPPVQRQRVQRQRVRARKRHLNYVRKFSLGKFAGTGFPFMLRPLFTSVAAFPIVVTVYVPAHGG